MNIVIILAGGAGTRLGADLPKQYIEVSGKPIIAYCLEFFETSTYADAVWIVADDNWHDCILRWTGNKFRGFSEPGANRQLSIWNALRDVRNFAEEKDIVIIHDAARPCVTDKIISDCLNACAEHDGALPVLPMKDTVYLGDGKRITSLLERKNVYAGQAPEAFVFGKYYRANRSLLPDKIMKINGSAEPAVIAGMDIALVDGEETNFKITTRADLERFIRMESLKK